MSLSSSSLTRNFSQRNHKPPSVSSKKDEKEHFHQNGFSRSQLPHYSPKSPVSSPEHKLRETMSNCKTSLKRNVPQNSSTQSTNYANQIMVDIKSDQPCRQFHQLGPDNDNLLGDYHQSKSNKSNLPPPPLSQVYGQICRKEFSEKLRFDQDNSKPYGTLPKNIVWVEVHEPKSNYNFYANFKTGQFQFERPKGVPILLASEAPQWFELFDDKTKRYYYYSGKENKTTWHKPSSSNLIIPITKLNYIQSNSKTKSSEDAKHIESICPDEKAPKSPQSLCERCLKGSNGVRDACTQTPADQLMHKASMVSRWTQTTNTSSVNIRLNNSGTNPHNVLPRPSLHHYLLSEARFAKGIIGNSVNASSDRLYDQVNEDFYDMVPNDNYTNVYEDDADDIVDEESDAEFSCDADDEYDVESYDDDEEEEEDADEEEDEEELVEEDEDYAEEEDFSEYEFADPNVAQAKFNQGLCKVNGPVARTAKTEEDDRTLDGVRMSASFTAVDFKRNAIGRSSYTPSMHHNYQTQQSHQPNSSAITYSNPFNMGSLRSSTGRIPASNIADRIQMFNQKSSKPFTPSPTPPASNANVTSEMISRSRNSTNTVISENIVSQQIQPTVPKYLQHHLQTPTKSHSLTLISQQQKPHVSADSNVSGEKSYSKNALVNSSIQSKRVDTSLELSQLSGKRSSWSKNSCHSPTNPIHSFDSLESHRKTSTPISGVAPSQQPTIHLSSTSGSLRGQLINFNDSHQAMLIKSNHHFPPHVQKQHSMSQTNAEPLEVGSKKKAEKKKSNKPTKTKSSPKKKSTSTKVNENSSVGVLVANNSIESFARECVSRHRKGGIFSKKKTLKSMLTHTKKPLKKPMISTISDSTLVKESVNCFKLIQIFMGDRATSPTSIVDSNSMSSHSTSDEMILMQLINVCVQLVPMRDEILVQVARQVTQNPCPKSERRGLELMCVLFWYFTASNKLASHLHAFLSGHRNQFTAIVIRKFEQQMHRSRHTHSHLFFRKPHSVEEVGRVLRCVRAQHVGLFGETLADAILPDEMFNQGEVIAPNDCLKLFPWPVIMLTEALLEQRHEDREGVFRCVGDLDDVHKLKMKIDTTLIVDTDFLQSIGIRCSSKGSQKLTDVHDIHVIASTLKLYFRELRQSVIPTEMYLEALECAHSNSSACGLLDKLPFTNRNSLLYLIRFLQKFSAPEHVRDTKMDDANLSMVWAPNILRSPINIATNSANIYEHTRAEMSLVRTMIQHLDTSCVS